MLPSTSRSSSEIARARVLDLGGLQCLQMDGPRLLLAGSLVGHRASLSTDLT